MKYNITYFEIVQITLEAMGAAFCIICLIALLIYGKTRILNTIKKLIVLNFFAQISDACAYIFRGNSDSVSLVMTRASNFFFFLIELLMVMYFVRLTCNLLEEYGIKTDRRILVASNILFSVAFILIITNLFTGILYYFDENNYYHRNTGWYFYTILIMLIMLMVLLYVASKRAIIDKSIIIGITIYTLVPIFSGCLQIIFYGISLLSFSITVSLMIIIYIHMRLTKNNSMQDGYSKKSNGLMGAVTMFFMLIIIMSISVVYNISEIQSIADTLSRENTTSIFYKVKNDIENEFYHPLAVSDALAENVELKKLFDTEITTPGDEMTEGVVSILNSMYKAFGYNMLFAASDATKNYYTHDKLSRTMDIYNDPNDSWYNDFMKTGALRELNVDTDKDNGMILSVFVNRLMLSSDGRALGVCGVGIEMTYLCDKIKQFEDENNVKIYLVDVNGLYMLNSDIEMIETEYYPGFNSSEVNYDVSILSDTDTGIVMCSYIAKMGWYLVMVDNNLQRVDVSRIVFFCILISLVGILLMSVVFWVLFRREKNTSDELEKTRVISYTDKLTGLGNRRAYDQEIFNICDQEQVNDYIIAMMDVNGLKMVNDTLGHDAGDELLCGAAECISNIFGKLGNVYRKGGDEFAAIVYCDNKEMTLLVEAFENETKGWSGDKVKELTISLGWICSSDYPDLSIDELEQKADELMYQNKTQYYIRTGKDRRKY